MKTKYCYSSDIFILFMHIVKNSQEVQISMKFLCVLGSHLLPQFGYADAQFTHYKQKGKLLKLMIIQFKLINLSFMLYSHSILY